MNKRLILSYLILLTLPLTTLDTHLFGQFTALPTSSKYISILSDNEIYLESGFVGWGPNWSWLGFKGTIEENGTESILTNSSTIKATGATISLVSTVKQIDDSVLQFNINLSTSQDTPLTAIVITLTPKKELFDKGYVIAESSNGTQIKKFFPLGVNKFGDSIKSLTYVDNKGNQTKITLAPPSLAKGSIEKNDPVATTMTVTLPGNLTYYTGKDQVPEEAEAMGWYPFISKGSSFKTSAINMEEWLEKPAGKYGRITSNGKKLYYNDKEIKLWGINLTFANSAPKKSLAKKRAAFYASYGINTVRLHKYADGPSWMGIQGPRSFLDFDPQKLDRMDYFIAQLKEHGIYTKLSPVFIVKLGVEDIQYVPYMEEFGTIKKTDKRGRLNTKHGSIFLSVEIQELMIKQITNLLKHKTPYTGLAYAEDPAIVTVEMYNEDDALFFGVMVQLEKSPTLRKRGGILFTEWLKNKYGSEEALTQAWGEKALNSFKYEKLVGESWDDNTILPIGNPWYFNPNQLNGSQKYRKQRLLDTIVFLYQLQNNFYDKYKKAIRDTGYEGEIITSNWQAGRGPSHFYNLNSDTKVGMVDRHNYFGGGEANKIKNTSMLKTPGSAILSSGMQQVENRPFMMSEWIHLTPTEWSIEGPTIIGAYGMGLQGWDVSYMFQNTDSGKMDNVFRDKWQIMKPTILGIFPAVSRQVLRGDVKESDLVIPLNVNMEALAEGRLDFDDKTIQQGDVKSFTTDKVPSIALAIGRVAVVFNDKEKATPYFDINKYYDDGFYISSTEQLRWKPGTSEMDGYFTINTDGTKAVVGFAEGETNVLGNVTIASKSRFGAIYVTALGKDEDIASGKKLLITAIARVRLTGMKVYNDTFILNKGKAPFVMEPVKTTISIEKEGTPTVYILDHDGSRTKMTLPVENGTIDIDTGRDKTPYYEIVYGEDTNT